VRQPARRQLRALALRAQGKGGGARPRQHQGPRAGTLGSTAPKNGRGSKVHSDREPRGQSAVRVRLRCRRQPRHRRRPEKKTRARGGARAQGGGMNERLRFGLFDWIEASRRSPGEVYRQKLELAQAADEAGFHAYLVAEHQGTPLSIDGSPSVMLSAMFQRTRRL